jgi:RNA polymerase sigma-70 factor (ECF subfamily)
MNAVLPAVEPNSQTCVHPCAEGNSASILSFKVRTKKHVLKTQDIQPGASKQDMRALMVLISDQRDRGAFIQVYEYFSPRVKSFLLGRNMLPQQADEVLQEVMLAVWQKAHQYSPDKAAVSTWIFTIARNKHIDRIRQEKFPELDAEDPSLKPAEVAEVEGEFQEMEQSKAVKEALATLPKDQYDVIYLSFMKGISHAEIGEHLDLPLGTVKSRIRLGFKRLRTELTDLGTEL